MPYLGDYLGHLISEITMARVQADLEAVRVAEIYANHSLLRYLPVPHFRLPTVTIDVPVVVKEMEVSKSGEPPRGGVTAEAVREQLDRLLPLHLKRAGLELFSKERASLKKALDQIIEDLVQRRETFIDPLHLTDELVRAAAKPFREPGREGTKVEGERLEKFAEELKAAVRTELLNLRKAPPRLNVLVTTSEVREAGPRDILAQIHLSISEEAYEWTMVETEGKLSGRLVPE